MESKVYFNAFNSTSKLWQYFEMEYSISDEIKLSSKVLLNLINNFSLPLSCTHLNIELNDDFREGFSLTIFYNRFCTGNTDYKLAFK